LDQHKKEKFVGMAKYQLTQVGKRKIKLSNLGKVLFPDAGIIKAELVAFYLQMAPTILRYIKQRPLSLIRYPDGIQAHQFFQKDKPDWAPDWVESVPLGKEEKKHYILATEEASIVWLANLACIELHIRQDKFPKNEVPNFFIFDLDPPASQPFSEIIDIALKLKEFIEPFGYHPFVKTSGGKGLHIFVPIEPLYDYDTMFESVKQLADAFVKKYPADCTLKINKEARKGKLLLDIYRNRGSQTIVAPYSVRGKEPGTVSMPVSWDALSQLNDPDVFHIRNVYDIVKSEGDAWEGFSSFAVTLHTDKEKRKGSQMSLPDSKYYKTPAQLKAYREKRDFSKTPEPAPQTIVTDGSSFVVHRHHASRLHYDLRLEKEGTLLSWAVPKGLPHKPGIKRLAVETEPHPIEYLQFDGEIPKGQYGGGKMWIFARGKYEITKEKKDGFYFHLSSPQIDGEYRIHNTKEKEWLLERVDRDLINILDDFTAPMLAENNKTIPADAHEYLYEVKWDGIRALIGIEEGEIVIRTRNNNIVTDQFPELKQISDSFRVSNGIFDGEIVCLDAQGRPDFKKVVSRLHHNSPGRIDLATKNNPVYCYLFDCLYLDGRSVINEPIERRKDWLIDSIKSGGPYRLSKHLDDGHALFEAARKMALEGVLAKRRKSKYTIGKRNKDWVKIKFRQTADCHIIGYTTGKGDRLALFGALHIAEINGGEMIYRGKVGTGFDDVKMKKILEEISKISRSEKPFITKIPDDKISTWISPELVCEIEFASITSNQTFREPVFIKMISR
jgi:DNA ligase D-like protein (predicted polymerase)/DNA ligase D-like protein (predicted ligase)/DNA ligase D-like protein (predicted 3'-phosphoesterase)